MNIAKFEKPTQNVTFLQALQGTMVRDSSPINLASVVSASIEKAWFEMGLKKADDVQDKNQLKSGIISEVNACFQTLTLDEIAAAINYGSRGRYGETFGLSVIGVAKWFAAYMTDQNRIEAKLLLEKINEPAIPAPSAAELIKMKKANALQAFDTYKKTGAYFDSGNMVYDNLVMFNLIKFNTNEKKLFLDQAIREAKEKNNPLNGRSSQERSEFRKYSAKLAEMQTTGEIVKDASIIADAKRIALSTFFKSLADAGNTLTFTA